MDFRLHFLKELSEGSVVEQRLTHNKMMAVGLNSAVDAQMIKVITLKKMHSIIRYITAPLLILFTISLVEL